MRRSARHVPARLTATACALVVAVGCSASDERETVGGPIPERSISDPPVSETESRNDTTDDTSGPSQPTESKARELGEPETVATGLHTPWDVDFLQDGSALVSLRDTGEVLRIVDREVTPLQADGPGGAVPDVHHETEDGLLGLAVGPEGDIFLYLTTASDNRVVRYELESDNLVNPRVILQGIPKHEHHNGGRLAFGPDGYLYVTVGDARELDLPQDTTSLSGKILRLTVDGEPAPGNPFDNEVWSYGHRNVQGIGWTSDGRMYASEFGSNEFDELNLIEAGGNYGWPHIEGWAGDPDYIDPLVTWSTDEASPSGIAVTDEGVWMTALRGERLWYIPLEVNGEVGEPREHQLSLGRLRTVVNAPDGSLWVVTSNTDGRGEPSDRDDRIVRFTTQ